MLIPVYSGFQLAVMDNLASDEIAATLGVMAVAFGLAFVLGQEVGFWVRRGRPGLIARMLQRWGARTFRHWYVRNLPDASSSSLYAAAVSSSSATSWPYSPSPSKMAPPWRRVSSGQGGEQFRLWLVGHPDQSPGAGLGPELDDAPRLVRDS